MSLGAILASLSAILTAVLGVIALKGDYRDDETGQITRLGRLNIAGILFLGAMSVASSVIADRNAKSDSERLLTEVRAGAVAANALSTSLEAGKLELIFRIPCTDVEYRVICKAGYDPGATWSNRASYRLLPRLPRTQDMAAALYIKDKNARPKLPDFPDYIVDTPVSLVGTLRIKDAGFYGERMDDGISLSSIIMTVPAGALHVNASGEFPSLMSFPGRKIQFLAIGAPFAKYIYGYRVTTKEGFDTGAMGTNIAVTTSGPFFVGEHDYPADKDPRNDNFAGI